MVSEVLTTVVILVHRHQPAYIVMRVWDHVHIDHIIFHWVAALVRTNKSWTGISTHKLTFNNKQIPLHS